MMAISNPADWFIPTSVPANETTTEPEAPEQTEFAALLAASYIVPSAIVPSAPAAPTPVITNAAEAVLKREVVTPATEFVLPTDVLSPVAASPMMTGVKAAEETIKAFPDTLPTQSLSPTGSRTDQMTKAAATPNNTTQDSNTTLLRSSEVTTKANLEKFVGSEKFVEQVPNLPTPITIAQVGNRESFARTTTPKQVEKLLHESAFLPGVAARGEQGVLRSADIRVSEREGLSVNTASNQIALRSQVTQADASFVDRSITPEQYVALDRGQSEFVTKVTLPQSREGQEKTLSVRMESPHQVITARKELTAVALETLTSIPSSVSPGNSDVLKPAVAAVKTIVTESSVALPPPSANVPLQEPPAARQATPTVIENDAVTTATHHDVVTQAEASPAETALQTETQREVLPMPFRRGAVTAQVPVSEDTIAMAKSVDATPAAITTAVEHTAGFVVTTTPTDTPPIFQVAKTPSPILVEPVGTQWVAGQWPRRNPASRPINLTQVDGTTEGSPTIPTPLPELVATQEPILSAPRPTPVQLGTTTEPVSANTPIPTNNFATSVSPEHTESSNVTVSSARQELTRVAVPPARTEFSHIAPLASAQEPTTVAFAAALQVEESGTEITIQSSLPVTTQSAVHQFVSLQPHAEVLAGNEAQPLVRQTIAPVIELAQRVETSSTRSLRLQLNPVELGRVEVEVKRDVEGHVSAVLKVEQAETAHTLTHSLGQLRESLERAGLVVEQLDVTFTPPLPSPTSQPFGQQFGQQTPQQHSSPPHFTNADSMPVDAAGTEGTAPAADQRLLSLHA